MLAEYVADTKRHLGALLRVLRRAILHGSIFGQTMLSKSKTKEKFGSA